MKLQFIIEKGKNIQAIIREKENERILAESRQREARNCLVARLIQDPEPLGYRWARNSSDLIPGAELYIADFEEAKAGLSAYPDSYTPNLVKVARWHLAPLSDAEKKAYARFGAAATEAKNKLMLDCLGTLWLISMFDLLDRRIIAWKKIAP